MRKRGEPCGSAPRVSAGRSLEQDFKLPAELFNCPACKQGFYYCPEHFFYTSLQSQVANIEIGKRACAVARRLHSSLEVGRVRQVKGEKQKVCNKA